MRVEGQGGRLGTIAPMTHASRGLPLLLCFALLAAGRAYAANSDSTMDARDIRVTQALNPLPRCTASWPATKDWLRNGLAGAPQRAEPSAGDPGDARWIRLDKRGRLLDAKDTASELACIQDAVTHLVWAVGLEGKSAMGRSPSGLADHSTQSLVGRANAERWCGKSDWRLPSKTQAMSLVRYSRVRFDADGSAWRRSGFPSVGSVWTDSVVQRVGRAEERWTVSLVDGYTYLESTPHEPDNEAQRRNALLVTSGSCSWFGRAFSK